MTLFGYFQYSNDPFIDAFCQILVFLTIVFGTLFVFGYAFLYYTKKGGKKGGKKETKKETKKEIKKDSKKHSIWIWLLISFLILICISVYLKMALDRLKVVQDTNIQQRYSWLYDYSKHDFTSPIYKNIYTVVAGFAMIFNFFVVISSKGGGSPDI